MQPLNSGQQSREGLKITPYPRKTANVRWKIYDAVANECATQNFCFVLFVSTYIAHIEHPIQFITKVQGVPFKTANIQS